MKHKSIFISCLVLLFIVGAANGAAHTQAGATFTVDSTTDAVDANPGDGTCATTVGECTLRAAVQEANALAGADTITFDIPPSDPGYNPGGWWTIRPATELPDLTDDGTTIDGTTQTANRGDTNPLGPEIELDGSLAGESGYGIDIRSNNNLVRGLVINRFAQDGVRIAFRDISGNRIVGNYIGTDARGQAGLGNRGGVTLDSGPHDNFIGGEAPGDGNVISGNGDLGGIHVFRANSNRIIGNHIGTDAAGSGILGNGEAGVSIQGGSQGNVVGPANRIAYNLIGVRVAQSGTTGNTITRNSIHSNANKGIRLGPGGNDELAPPLIATANAAQVAGAACPNCVIEVFSDAEDEGAIYEGTTTADAAGNWTFTKPDGLAGPNVTATATDAGGNTSAFSAPVAVEGEPAVRIYLPIVLKNYPRADVIFHNGTVLTMEADQPQAQAIAVKGEKILAVGSDEEVLALRGPETQVVDLQGRTLMPGFVDAHTHIFNDAEAYLDMNLEEAQQLALENGITTLGDMYVPPEFLEQMQNFARQGRLRVRTSLYLIYTTNCGDILGDWYTEHPPTRESGEMLRIGGVKIFADGGTCGRPALSFEYRDWGNGDLFLTQEQLNQAVSDAQAAGYQVAIHAIGDRALEQAQNAIEAVLAGKPNSFRHRIDHNILIRPDLLQRYSDIGIVPVVFGNYPTCAALAGEEWTVHVGAERLSWVYPYRALLDANPGLHVAWHGDDPWHGPISPVLELHNMVTRKEIAEDGVTICEPPDWLAATAVTVQEALSMMTIESAYALFRDQEVGSLKPGKFADLVILSDNPLTVEPDAIKDIEVLMTMVGGRVEHCAPGCPGFSQNLALTKPVTASRSLPTNPPELAVDGDLETHWGAGSGPPQWIEVDLQAPFTIDQIRLAMSQFPDGETGHRVWGKGPGAEASYRLLHEFSGSTTDRQVLEYSPPTPWKYLRFIKVETVQSPSWVSWREIEVYGDTTAVPAVPEHRIGIRVVDGVGEFYDRTTGEKFVPRGSNYDRWVWVDPPVHFDALFNTEFGQLDQAEEDLRKMHENGYNVVRVWINKCLVEVGGCIGDPTGGLVSEYLDNVAEFLRMAKRYGIYVMFTDDQVPEEGGYFAIQDPWCCEAFNGYNLTYLTPGGISANQRYLQDIIWGLIERDAPLDAILAYQLRNEAFFEAQLPPLTFTSGLVTTANGQTYDMANPEDRQRMMDEGWLYYIDQMVEAIKELDPTALVTMGFFAPQDPNIDQPRDPRLVNTGPILRESSLDFVDLHAYPGFDDTTIEPIAERFELMGIEAKPIVMGEFGAVKEAMPSLEDAAMVLQRWQVESCAYGFDGWFLWTWGSSDAQPEYEFWGTVEGEEQIYQALAPAQRPDPCQPGPEVLNHPNLAYLRPVTASNFEEPIYQPEKAVDLSLWTWWSSGAEPPQWIEIDLEQPTAIGGIRLSAGWVAPLGFQRNRVWVKGPGTGGEYELLHEFETEVELYDVLEYILPEPMEGVRYVKVETLESDGWAIWHEIEVLSGE